MPLLLALLLPASAGPGDDLLARGRAAAAASDPAGAAAAFRECTTVDPAAAGCWWELGWLAWNRNEWSVVVDHWSRVKALNPAWPDLGSYLPFAEEHVAAARWVAEAPKAPRAPLPPGTTLRLRAVGDLMIGSDFPGPAFPPGGAEHVFDGVADLLRDADVTFGNLEGPLCDGGVTTKCKEGQNCYAFRTPTRFATTYADVGFDLLSTANNHAEDFGRECRLQTEAALEGVKIAYSGRPGTVAIRDVPTASGAVVRVAMVGFHTNPNSHYVNDPAEAAAMVRGASARADLVIVSFHGGAEGSKQAHVPDRMETFYGEQRGHLRKFARTVIAAGADVVIGHGPHVLRGLEVVDGHLVAYSLGNFATYGRFNLSGPLGVSAVLEVTLGADGRLVGGRVLPTIQEGDGIPAKDPAAQSVALLRELSTADFGDGAPVLADDGTFAPRAAGSP